jgi:hypothetical protein
MQLSTSVKKKIVVFVTLIAPRYNSTTINADVADGATWFSRQTILQ